MNHDADPFDDVSTSVVIALAEAKGVDPLDLEDPLHDCLDPDALDAMVDSMESGHVTFDLNAHRVRVDADATITVNPAH